MKTLHSGFSCAALLGVALCASTPASAVQMSVYVYEPYQVLTSGNVRVGHAVSASTDFNRLVAGGTFLAQCAHPQILSVPGQRTETASGLVGGLSMTVTVPEQQPAYINMPGFDSLPRGTTVDCTYAWTARAVESGYTLSGGGLGVPIGQGEKSDGAVRYFKMKAPSTDPSGNPKCIP